MDKKEIRKRLLKERLDLSGKDIDLKSREIAKKVIENDIVARNGKVSLYLPVKNEVETSDIINFLVETGLEIYLPKYFASSQEYKLARFKTWEDLETGPYGIRQPMDDETVNAGQISVAFLPGVAFDKKGTRLGYGKGVYDKLFAKSNATLAGLAYGFQVVDQLPRENHDLAMNLIVTDEKVYQFSQQE